MNHGHKKNWRNVYILIGLLVFTAPWLFLIDSGKPQIKYIDVPVPIEPQACPITPEASASICPVPLAPYPPPEITPLAPATEPGHFAPASEPSDMPTPWKIIPKPGLPKAKLAKPHLSKRHISKPLEYIDANGTRFYPMKNWPY